MKEYKVEAKFIVRPYLTIKANSEQEAWNKIMDEEFDRDEFTETGFPATMIEIDKIEEQ